MSVEENLVKKHTKIVIGEDEHTLEDDMSIDELLEIIKENPAYRAATKDNLFEDENGNIEVSSPKSATHGANN